VYRLSPTCCRMWRSVTGVLPSVLAAKALNHTVMLPEANCAEASLVEGASLLATQNLIQAAAHLSGSVAITEKTGGQSSPQPQHQYAELDLGDVCGQSFGVRSLEIAAAGGHSLMMVGSPGCGKPCWPSGAPAFCRICRPVKPLPLRPFIRSHISALIDGTGSADLFVRLIIALLQRPWLEADPGWPRGKSPLRIMACSFLTS